MRTQRRSRAAVAMRLVVSASVFERFVVDRVEHRDEVPVDLDRVRHVHVAAEGASHALGDHGLAVTGRAVEEHRLARVDRRAELLEDVVADDEMREAAPEAFAIDVAACGHQARASRRRTRRAAPAPGRCTGSRRDTAARGRVPRRSACIGSPPTRTPVDAPDLDEPLGARVLDERLQQPERQAHAIRDGQTRSPRRVYSVLISSCSTQIRAQARVLERLRDRRRRRGIRDVGRWRRGEVEMVAMRCCRH